MNTRQYGYVRSRGGQLVDVFSEQVLQVRRDTVLSGHIQLRVTRIAGEGDSSPFADGELLTNHIGYRIGHRSSVDIVRAKQLDIACFGIVGQPQRTVAARLNNIAVPFA